MHQTTRHFWPHCIAYTDIDKYTVAQKSKPLSNDQKIVLIAEPVYEIRFCQIKVWIKHYNISLFVGFILCMTLSEINNYACRPQIKHMR